MFLKNLSLFVNEASEFQPIKYNYEGNPSKI